MPAPPPPVETRWKKGQSGNPSGKSRRNEIAIAFKEMTYNEFIGHMQSLGFMAEEEFEAQRKRTDITVFQKMMINWIKQAKDGNEGARNSLVERLWGKVKDTQEHTIETIQVDADNVKRLCEIARGK